MPPNNLRSLLLSIFVCSCATSEAQQWHSTDSIPLYRGTSLQGLAITNSQQSVVCLSNLRQLNLAAWQWADNGFMPQYWQQFTNQMASPAILYCPKDTAHPQQTNWSFVNFSALSYRIVSPGARVDESQKIFLECIAHTNHVLVAGSTKERTIYNRDAPLASDGGLRLLFPALNGAKRRALSSACVSQLKNIGTSARIYSADNNGFFPHSLAQTTNELGHPAVLFCPAEQTNVIPNAFSQLNFSNVSYRILAPGISENEVDTRYAQCRTHGNYVLVGGSAHEESNRNYPLIVGDPFSQTVELSQRVEFSVVTHTNLEQAPFRFQWRKQHPFDSQGHPFTNTVILAGATNRTLVFTNAQAGNEGYYDVVVLDSKGGYQESYMAYLRVEPLTLIKNTFAWESLCCMQNLRNINLACRLYMHSSGEYYYPSNFFDVQSFLGWPLTLYCPSDDGRQPPQSWATVNFSDTSYLLYSNVSELEPMMVLAQCKIHGFRVLSDGSVPDFIDPPRITKQPTSATVSPGATTTFTVAAIGVDIAYQWKLNGANFSGGNGSLLTLSNITTNQAGRYTVVVSNAVGAVTSEAAILAVIPAEAPAILSHPTNRSIFAGEATIFTVSASGTDPLGYQWRKGGTAISGATNQTYSITNAQQSHAGNYSVVVSNIVGNLASESAALVIHYRLSVSNTAGGIVIRNPNQDAILPNTTVTLTAVTNEGSRFLGWSGNLNSTLTSVTFAMNGHKAVLATFFIPDIVIDNPAASFVGNWSQNDFASSRYGIDYRYHATKSGAPSASADYRPRVDTAGSYDVYIWYPEGTNRSISSIWEIHHAAGVTVTNINQTIMGGQWVAIGRQCSFAQGTSGFVRLLNHTGESGRFVMADAVAFIYSPTLTLTPHLLSQPQSISLVAGQTASMQAQAVGGGPLWYQWRKDTLKVAGANEPTLRLINAQTNLSGKYSVLISNQFGQVLSSEADLIVYPADLFKLMIARTNSGFGLSWPTNVGYRLQFTTNLLGQPIVWSELPGITSPYKVTATTNESLFFRLLAQ